MSEKGGARWLLMLGSNLPTDERLRRAMAMLSSFGRVEGLGDILHLPSRSSGGMWYFNSLVAIESTLERGEFRKALASVEDALGRDRSDPEIIAIDVDVLAVECDGEWVADAHAVEKNELERWPANRLLSNAGLSVRNPG